MLNTRFDFSEFKSLVRTEDSGFISGQDGVKAIKTPKDGRSEFIFFADKTLVSIKSGTGKTALYPLREPYFFPKAEAVLMDLDGTSVQSEEFWVWIIQSTMRRMIGPEFELTQADVPFVSGFSVSEHLKYCLDRYMPGGSLNEARRLYFETVAYEMDEIMKGRGNRDAFKPAPGLKEFLLTLKDNGVKIGLVTSGLYAKAIPVITAAFLALDMGDPLEFYDAVITAGTAYGSKSAGTLGELCAKPHPWLYAEAARVGLGLSDPRSENHIIGIEDSSAGVLAVALAGYAVAGMDNGNISEAGLDGILSCGVTKLTDLLPKILL